MHIAVVVCSTSWIAHGLAFTSGRPGSAFIVNVKERTPGPSSPLAASGRHPPPRIRVCTVTQSGIGSREERFRACESSHQGA